jgi:predicted DCC family thiol-disulfide oxidoreductase YuxK
VRDFARPLLIFDGDCAFCTSCANWVAARWHGRAQAVPWQTLDADQLAAQSLTGEQARSAVWWIDAAGERSRGHMAIAHALSAGSGLSAAAGRVLLVPPFRWIGAAIYPLIVRWRHLLPGGTPACRM